MSELPEIDATKVAQRTVEKLRRELAESQHRESTLEILAEALRDQRDALQDEINVLKTEVEPVHNVTTLPEAV